MAAFGMNGLLENETYRQANRIYLVGFMGSGKSTLGLKLANESGRAYCDMDSLIEAISGRTTKALFEISEATFRFHERTALLYTATLNNIIVATGGGTACYYDNMEFMNKSGLSIYLKVPSAILADRLLIDKKERPLLKGQGKDSLLTFIEMLLKQRESYYKHANLTLDNS